MKLRHPSKSLWLLVLGLLLVLLNAAPAFAANGVIWGT